MNTSMTTCTAASGVSPAATTAGAMIALNSTSAAPVGESMPIVRGGSDVRSAIPTPPTQLPINIAQIAIGIPSPSAPGNISAPNETILAMSTIDATTPAIESLNQ
ncbi:MAG TPA: hypothetical protein VFM89_10270 [Casimicrobiaceae bacterium]|nr:hypothetical protein [Casimicrobiaceae bacterium]